MIGFWICAGHVRVFAHGLAGVPAADGAALDGFLHVLADAERASGAGVDRHFQLAAIAELAPGVGQRNPQVGAECIEPLGTVHADDEDGVASLCFEDTHAKLSVCAPGAITPGSSRRLISPDSGYADPRIAMRG